MVIQTYSRSIMQSKLLRHRIIKLFMSRRSGTGELLGYPPAEELMAVLAAGEDERLLETGCKYLKEYVLRIKGESTTGSDRSGKSGSR